MALTESQLQKDLQAAMRARDERKLSVLRGIVAALKNLKVEKMVQEIPEADLVAIVRKEVSKRKEALSYAEKGGRADLVEQNQAELAFLETYMPAQVDAEQLETIIRALAAEIGSTQIGPLMAELRKRHAGNFDNRVASEIIRKLSAAG